MTTTAAETVDTRPDTSTGAGASGASAGASDALHGGSPTGSASAPGSSPSSSSSASSSSNPLVVGREESRSAVSGSGVVEDIWGICHGLSEGSWLEIGLSSVSLVADAVGVGVDPLGTLVAWGAGWLIDHFGPLKSWMDELLGDADSVRADAATWSNVAQAMGECADALEGDEKNLMGDQVGATATAYRASNQDTVSALRTASGAADAMGRATSVLAEVVGLVHDLLRDAISAIVGALASAIIEAIATFGLAIPLIIAQVQTKVGAKATQMAAHVTAVLRSARALGHNLTHLSGLLDMLRGMLTRTKNTAGSLKSTIADAASHAKGGKDDIPFLSRFKRPDKWTERTFEEEAERAIKASNNAKAKRDRLLQWFTDRGLEPSEVSRANIDDTLEKLLKKGVSPIEIRRIERKADELARARRAICESGERLGQIGAEFAQQRAGRYLIPGVGGVGVGKGHFDLLSIGADKEGQSVLHFVEAKGGRGRLGTVTITMSDGTKVTYRQGSGGYLNHIATKDSDFHRFLAENTDLWERIKSGQVKLSGDVCRTPLCDPAEVLGRVREKSVGFEFSDDTVKAIDKAIESILGGATP